MSRTSPASAVAVVAAFAIATAASAATPFLAKAAQGDQAEVELGQLAQDHAASAAVKSYGATLVQDHGSHREKVTSLAATKGVTVPAGLDAEATKAKTHLASLSGAAFDKAFKAHMVADHKKDIALYRTASRGSDAEVAAMARQTLPVLEKHLAMAQKL